MSSLCEMTSNTDPFGNTDANRSSCTTAMASSTLIESFSPIPLCRSLSSTKAFAAAETSTDTPSSDSSTTELSYPSDTCLVDDPVIGSPEPCTVAEHQANSQASKHSTLLSPIKTVSEPLPPPVSTDAPLTQSCTSATKTEALPLVPVLRSCPLRYFTYDEVRSHNTRDNCWVVVDGKVYDVTRWIPHHPAGEVIITSVAGVDVTDVFIVSHHPWVRKCWLPQYQIGYVKDYAPSDMSRDFQSLALALEREGWYKTSTVYYIQLLAWYALLFLSSLYCVICTPFFLSRCILGASLMALFWQQVAFLGHDLGHMSVSHKRITDNLCGVIGGNLFMGIAIGWWKATHNVHHVVANHLEYDPDIQHLPVLAISTRFRDGIYSFYFKRRMEFDAVAQFFVRRQHWLYYPIMFVARFNLYLQSILLLSRPAAAIQRGVTYPRLELLMLGCFYLWYSQLLRCFPTWTEAALFTFLAHGLAGVLHVQICLSHFPMQVFDAKDGRPLEKVEFLRNQIASSLDVICRPALDWFHGGLQFQSTHHCFPLLPRHRLRAATTRVKQLCQKYALKYNEVDFWTANVMIVQTLKATAEGAFHPWLSAMVNCDGMPSRILAKPFAATNQKTYRIPAGNGSMATGVNYFPIFSGIMVLQFPIILTVIIVFIAAEQCSSVSPFAARKLVHFMSGVLLLATDITPFTRLFILFFALAVPIANWTAKPLRFTTAKDKGIAYFGVVVFLWAYLNLPYVYLAPMFLADPLAALVGYYSQSRPWIGNKTVWGSATFFFTAYGALLFYEASLPICLLVACTCTLLEALARSHDNILLPIPLALHYLYSIRTLPHL